MSNGPRRAEKTLKLTYLALMTAMVVVCELLSIFVGGIFTITFALVPIVIGAAICGPWGGAWLGGVFSVIVLFTDAGAFLAINPAGTVVTVILKGTLCGLAAGLTYIDVKEEPELYAEMLAREERGESQLVYRYRRSYQSKLAQSQPTRW